jgi:hypothetical protein
VYINPKGEVCIELDERVTEAQGFSEGLAAIVSTGGAGFIDAFGKIVIPLQYGRPNICPMAFHGGRALVLVKRSSEFIDKAGHVVFALDDSMSLATGMCEDGMISYRMSGLQQVGFMDAGGAVVLPPSEAMTIYANRYSCGVVPVSILEDGDSRYMYYDTHGKCAIDLGKSRSGVIHPFSEGYAWVRFRGTGWRIVNLKGQHTSKQQDLNYDEVRDFHDGRAAVLGEDKTVDGNNARYGFVDVEGNVIITPQFLRVDQFSDGLCAVSNGGRTGFIDVNGKMVVSQTYRDHEDECRRFAHGLAAVYIGRKWGFIDKGGRLVIPAMYRAVGDFQAVVDTPSGGGEAKTSKRGGTSGQVEE